MVGIGTHHGVRTIAMLTDKHEDGTYRIPFIIHADAYASETVAYADLVLPDTTYLERWDCISLLDRPSGEADAACDAIRQPVVAPDRDVRPFQDVLIELGVRLRLPGLVTEDGSARYPGGYADYMVNHQRKPGIGPLGGWRGEKVLAEARTFADAVWFTTYIPGSAAMGRWRGQSLKWSIQIVISSRIR